MEQKFSQEIEELLVKYLTGTADMGEREKALSWIRGHDENKRYFDQLRDIYEASKLTQKPVAYNTDMSWEKVKVKYYKKRLTKLENENLKERRFFIRVILKYAAIIVAVFTLGNLGYKFVNKTQILDNALVWNEVEAPFGSRTLVNLADGSKVWLNAGSKLKYAVDFGKKNRVVFLNGEAYFNVTKNKEIQFVVKTSHLDVKVFGTEFNVKAYPEENTIQTTLVRGAVSIVGSGPNQKEVQLKPNQLVTYIKNVNLFKSDIKKDKSEQQFEKAVHESENLVILPEIRTINFTSWKDSRWIIDGETLANLAIKLERRYNVKFQIKSETLQNYKFSGTLKDETLEQVLNLIKISAPIEFKIQERNVLLYENKSFKNSYDKLLINR
jgi:ferric-dicitrate binding protein FerR (iron transport regulator)